MENTIKETIGLLDSYAKSIKDYNTTDGKFDDSDMEDEYNYHLSLINSLQNIIGEGEDSEWQNDLTEYVYACPQLWLDGNNRSGNGM